MKNFGVVSLFVIGLTLLSSSTGVRGSSCSSASNPFITHLVSKGVTLKASPDKTTGKCGEEWRNFGTCCDVQSLEFYISEQQKEFKDNHKRFVEDLLELAQNADQAINVFRKTLGRRRMMMELEELRNLSSQYFNEFKIEYEKKNSELLTKDEKFFFSLIRVVTDNLPNIEKTKDKCKDRMAKVRSSAACFTCSGRSPSFFQDNKVLINMQDCKAIIYDCQPYWKYLVIMSEHWAK